MESDLPDHGICHVPEEGRSDDVWWFGFDCGHAWDLSPALEMRHRKLEVEFPGLPSMPDDMQMRMTYKPVAFVREEVRHLAEQLAKLA